MTLGDKIKQARNMRHLTQSELGSLIGLPTFRIGQYETGVRSPKETQLQEIADALGVNIEFFRDRSLDTYNDVMHALFELEKTFGLQIISDNNGKLSLTFDDQHINEYISTWKEQKENSLYSQKDKDFYEEWKITFPQKIVTEQENILRNARSELRKK